MQNKFLYCLSRYLEAPSDKDETKLVHLSYVSRADKPVSVDGSRRISRIVQVPHENVTTAHQNLCIFFLEEKRKKND